MSDYLKLNMNPVQFGLRKELSTTHHIFFTSNYNHIYHNRLRNTGMGIVGLLKRSDVLAKLVRMKLFFPPSPSSGLISVISFWKSATSSITFLKIWYFLAFSKELVWAPYSSVFLSTMLCALLFIQKLVHYPKPFPNLPYFVGHKMGLIYQSFKISGCNLPEEYNISSHRL